MFDDVPRHRPSAPGDLNDEQAAVAAFDGGSLRVIAGAGTGKTTALAARVTALISRGIRPERIMLLTFSRRAAAEMVSRANASLAAGQRRGAAWPHARAAGGVVGGTFHSVAHRTLRQHAQSLGLSPGFTVIDPADAADLIDVIRQEQVGDAATKSRMPRKGTLAELYSRSVSTGRPLRDVVGDSAPWCASSVEAIGGICREFVARKRQLALVDFDDLLLLWRGALRSEQVGAVLAQAYDHVLVDEYQDVNRLQVEILQSLRRSDPRLTVVGDDAQAIYSFRAADPKYILGFEEDFPGAETLRLTVNYRSLPEIISVANALAEDATVGFTTRLRPTYEAARGSGRPQLVRCRDEQDQSDAVCEQILAHREEGVLLQKQAVLVRAAHHTGHLELELARRSIPFVKYGGLRYLEAAHVKDLLAAFRIADNPRDMLSWYRLLQRLDGVGPATARRVTDALGVHDEGEDSEVMMRWPLAAAELPSAVREAASRVAFACQRKLGETPGAHAQRICTAVAPLIEDNYENHAARLADLDALVNAAGNVTRLADVAADHALDPPKSTGDLAGAPLIDEDWLVLSTVHSAKGLEWDVVHVLHAADGNFPSDMALTTKDGLEEERRLFYVAATRPRRHLHVYVPLRYHHHPSARDDRHSWAQPSRFLSERVRSHFDEIARAGDTARAATMSSVEDVVGAVDDGLADLWG